MKKYLIGTVFISILFTPVVSFAQGYASLLVKTDSPSVVSAINCTNLTYNTKFKSKDTNEKREVKSLQNFLQSNGYLSVNPTGYFGKLTLEAVKSFQTANGIDSIGSVGPITRAKIKVLSCNGSQVSKTDNNAPTALLTINGTTSITANVGDAISIKWSSTKADTFFNQLAFKCLGSPNIMASKPVEATASGTDLSNIESQFAGCYTIVYYVVKNSNTGQEAISSVQLYVKPVAN